MESESGSNPNPNWIYDVFLNSCPKEVGGYFISSLKAVLGYSGVSVYMDYTLRKGEDSVSSVGAIEASRISILILSESYADSTRSMDELVKIMECRRTIGQIVLPVFYHVDPSDVRHQKGPFNRAFAEHEQRMSFRKDKLMSWRISLNEASNVAGFFRENFSDQDELIMELVGHVVRLLYLPNANTNTNTNTDLFIADNLVGVKSRVQELTQLLNYPQLEYTQLVGIWGVGGIGKTTIAAALYNQIGHNFEYKCFLLCIGQRCRLHNGPVRLLQELVSAISKTTNIKKDAMEFGTLKESIIISQIRIFLVLDNVDQRVETEALSGVREWFAPGSIIIITSRDEKLLSMLGVDHVHRVKGLDENESLEYFSRKAFQQASPREDFIQIPKEVVSYCGGLPLALKVLGILFYKNGISDLKNILQTVKTEPSCGLLNVLRSSFDGLTNEEKKIFLDIALFFVGMDRNDAMHKLNVSTHVAGKGIQVLKEKALVTTDEENKLRMLAPLRDLGRLIIRENSQNRTDQPKIYDVFLSFRGEDTRHLFISHFYTYLHNAGIHAFKDTEELRRGDQISLSLPEAIRSSRIAIVVLSQHYANSRWCLKELEDIMKCRRTMGLLVVPVFYHVDPSHVRHQTGEFGASFNNLISGISMDVEDLENWKRALLEVGSLAGFVFVNNRNESKDVQAVVDKVIDLLDDKDLFVADHPVGVDSRVHDVIRLLNSQQSDDPLILGIWGMGGLGKTTIAKASYNQMRRDFDAKSILLNVREVWEQNNGQVSLQQRLLSDIYKTTKIKIDTVDSGKKILERRLGGQERIFLLLDDVDKLEQIQALCGHCNWFGKGSRIIITTRDESLLSSVFGDVRVYKMKAMDENESLELFSWHAFKQPSPREGFADLSRHVIKYCGSLPLALQVIGSFLLTRCRMIKDWERVLDKLKIIPAVEVLTKLRISFDGLCDDDVKEIFLDIAFFFIGMEVDDAIEVLNDCGHFAEIGINILVQQSLVTVDNKNKIRMHDLIRDMGREIVRQNSIKMVEERSRLWLYKDIQEILSKNRGMIAVEGLTLKPTAMDTTTPLETKAFQKMKRLRLLQLVGIQLKGDYKYLPRDLRWLCWHGFPLEYTPANFHQRSLVAIDLKYSNLKQVWNKPQELKKLKFLNLSHSPNLKQTPDFSYLPNLEKLILKDCPSLSLISHTIGHLNKIFLINLKDCTGLRELPRSIYKLESLKTLILSGCTKIDKLEEDIEQMKSLTTLIAKKTGISRVPLAIVRSKSIGYISMCGYEGFSRDVFPSIVLSWMSPTNNILSHVQTCVEMSSLAFSDERNGSYGFHDPSSNFLRELQELQRLWVKFDSEVQLNQTAEKIINITNSKKFEATSSASEASSIKTSTFFGGCCHGHNPKSKNSLTTLLFQMGMNCHVTHILRENILQEMPPTGPGLLPSDNYPDWLTFNSESSSVYFEVPQVNRRTLKTIMCIVYYSSQDNLISEGPKNVMLINYSKITMQLYNKDALTAFEDDADGWQRVVSNIEPGNKVKFVVAFGNGFIVKKTTLYLIFEELINEQSVINFGGDQENVKLLEASDAHLPKKVRVEGEPMQNQPKDLQVIFPQRSVDPFRTQYPLVLFTLGAIRQTLEEKLCKEPSEALIDAGMKRVKQRKALKKKTQENVQKEKERKACEASETEARKKRKEEKLREFQAKAEAKAIEKKRLVGEEQRKLDQKQAKKRKRKEADNKKKEDKASNAHLHKKVRVEGEPMQNQPRALQVIFPQRSVNPFRTQYPLVLFTPGAIRQTLEEKLGKEPFGRRRHNKRKVAKPVLKPPPTLSASFNLDGSLRIAGTGAGLFPTMPIHEAFKFPHLMDPKDLHVFYRLEQEKCLVRDLVVMGTGPEGSLSKAIMRPQTSIHIAPDRLMLNIPPVKADKGKEKMVYHKSNPQPFLKHNLLDTTCIWAKELNKKNRAKLASFPNNKRVDLHAFRYLQDHHYQMIKASSSSGLTQIDRAKIPTIKGIYTSYPIDRLYHNFHQEWQIIPNRPPHQWHLIFMSIEFKKSLHLLWAYKLGWNLHFFKIATKPLVPSIPPFTWHSKGLFSFDPTPPSSPLKLKPPTPQFIHLSLEPFDQPDTSQQDPTPPHISPKHFLVSPRPPIPSPQKSPPHPSPGPFDLTPQPSSLQDVASAPRSEVDELRSVVLNLAKSQQDTNHRLDQQVAIIAQQNETIAQMDARQQRDHCILENIMESIKELMGKK